MTTNLAASGENGADCRHNTPVNVADLRIVKYTAIHGPEMYEFLGGGTTNLPGCMVSFGPYGEPFAYGLGSQLMAKGKDIKYARLTPSEEPSLTPLNGNPLVMADLRGRKIILTSDCLTREERAMVDKRLGELRNEFGFGEVAYALEKE